MKLFNYEITITKIGTGCSKSEIYRFLKKTKKVCPDRIHLIRCAREHFKHKYPTGNNTNMMDGLIYLAVLDKLTRKLYKMEKIV